MNLLPSSRNAYNPYLTVQFAHTPDLVRTTWLWGVNLQRLAKAVLPRIFRGSHQEGRPRVASEATLPGSGLWRLYAFRGGL